MKNIYLLVLMFSCNSLIDGSLAKKAVKCGLDPEAKRIVTLGARGLLMHAEPKFDLLRVDIEDMHTVLWAIGNVRGMEQKSYKSVDRGLTWILNQKKPANFTNLPRTHEIGTLRLVGIGTVPIMYELTGCVGRLSTDGGMTWDFFVAHRENGSAFSKCTPVNVGRQGYRTYLYSWNQPLSGLWRSEDYGHNYKYLSNRVGYVSESIAMPNRIYGVANDVLRRSDDDGKEWIDLVHSKFMFQPIYKGRDEIYRTWDKDGHGEDLGYPGRIEQIQTDPVNKDIVYILTYKGLYRSSDGGDSFVLLGLEADKVLSIDRIACDPLDGGLVYAVVGREFLYRSNDWGCTWHKIKTPEEQSL